MFGICLEKKLIDKKKQSEELSDVASSEEGDTSCYVCGNDNNIQVLLMCDLVFIFFIKYFK